MKSKKNISTEKNAVQKSGSSKDKATFDQNGKGGSAKYGQAGTTPNESGNKKGTGTV